MWRWLESRAQAKMRALTGRGVFDLDEHLGDARADRRRVDDIENLSGERGAQFVDLVSKEVGDYAH